MGSPSEFRDRHPAMARVLPAAFFLGGFLFDAFTLGRQVIPIDFVILTAYYLACAGILIVIGRGIEHRWADYQNLALQWLFGGIFNALVIFYFLSASELGSFLLVGGLGVILVGNELLEKYDERLALSWSFFTISGIMYFNFALPHLVRSIRPIWFYVGVAVAVGATLVLRLVSTRRASLAPSLGVAAVLIALQLANVLPPVPLVKKAMFIAHAIDRTPTGYVATLEPAPSWKIWLRSSPLVHRIDGEPVYCFTSIFVPRGIETRIVHRWQFFDRSSDSWRTTDMIGFTIRGGRRGGYRGYTEKSNLAPGLWRVRAESTDGRAIGIIEFRIVDAPPGEVISFKRIAV